MLPLRLHPDELRPSSACGEPRRRHSPTPWPPTKTRWSTPGTAARALLRQCRAPPPCSVTWWRIDCCRQKRDAEASGSNESGAAASTCCWPGQIDLSAYGHAAGDSGGRLPPRHRPPPPPYSRDPAVPHIVGVQVTAAPGAVLRDIIPREEMLHPSRSPASRSWVRPRPPPPVVEERPLAPPSCSSIELKPPADRKRERGKRDVRRKTEVWG